MPGTKLRIVVVGMGYVGVTAAACLASEGHTVIGVDVNEQKVATLQSGRSPIEEPGVEGLLGEAHSRGLFHASRDLPSLSDVDLVIVCVGTPSAADGSHNMGFIAESTRQIARALDAAPGRRVTVAYRSTFRPGTMEELISPIFRDVLGPRFDDGVELVYNPEFLRESSAISDYFAPPKIVLGTDRAMPSEIMRHLHRGLSAPVFETPFREAEITKFIDNSWHAAKVAFANEVGRICDAYGIDARVAHQVFVSDTKLNISPYYMRPGAPFGGSCLPKDVRAMQFIAADAGVEVELLNSLLRSNDSHREFQLHRVIARAPHGSRLLIAGLAFKAGTDDLRESPNVSLVSDLVKLGYQVRVFDPAVKPSALVGQNLGYVLTAIPRLRELLIEFGDIRPDDFDLVVANNSTAELLGELSTPQLNLAVIGR